MNNARQSESKIVGAWHENASPWTTAVREGRIESRVLATDRALIDTIVRYAPRTIVDLGCGEGWLTRALVGRGFEVTGVDVVPELIQAARQSSDGDFRVLSYEAFAAGSLAMTVDAVVCNFSLLGQTSVELVLRALPDVLNPGGALIVQTLHPLSACGDAPYVDGWREGTWAGIGEKFAEPAPWYFRTLESWIALIRDSGLQLQQLREPLHPATGKPASLILVACAPAPIS